jgi:anion-transporting  ArsA/GET3 family ATPase
VSTLDHLLKDTSVVVSVGSGGVGKTTTAAITALHAALRGKRALVMTVDPARRLANSLGVDGLGHEIERIALPDAPGELWATMLDMKSTFDGIVERYSADEETTQRILSNRFYHHFSTSLAGSQELSASERLFEVVESGEFDLVVLDTPPTANALDFLDAPVRFFEALDSAAIQWVIAATGFARGKGLVGMGTQFVLKTLGRFTGQEFFQELGEFLFHFSGLLDGIQERSHATQRLLRDSRTRFVIVTTPNPSAIEEALGFRARLDDFGVHVGGVVVNRTHRGFGSNTFTEQPLTSLTDALVDGAGPGTDRASLARIARVLLDNANAFKALATRDDQALDELQDSLGPSTPVVRVPTYATDVHTIKGLLRMRRDLFGE